MSPHRGNEYVSGAGRAAASWRPRGCLSRMAGLLSAVALPVLAPRPAAGSALAFLELLLSAANAAFPGHLLLGILDPADELVAGQRRDVLPGIEGRGIGDQCLAQVRWKLVHHSTGHALTDHRTRVTVQAERVFVIPGTPGNRPGAEGRSARSRARPGRLGHVDHAAMCVREHWDGQPAEPEPHTAAQRAELILTAEQSPPPRTPRLPGQQAARLAGMSRNDMVQRR